MKKRLKDISIVKMFLTIAAGLVLSCSDYNPFADDFNANIEVLKSSFKSTDTVSIFSTETLSFVIKVPERIDSVVVKAVGNRLFSNGVLKIDPRNDEDIKKIKTGLNFSYCDTGWKSIEVLTYKKTGAILGLTELLFVKSPLFQSKLYGFFNVDLHLNTPSVPDRVDYIWAFPDTVIKSSSNSADVKLFSAGEIGRGWLYVTNGMSESQSVPFEFSLDDTTCPLIWVANSETIMNDTIVTGNSEFPLRVIITDIGSKEKIFASIDTRAFDIERDSLHIKVFSRIDTLKAPMQVVITAKDNSVRVNKTEKKIWIKYDPLKEKSKTFSLSILIPSQESIESSTSTRTFYGVIRRYTRDTNLVKLTFFVNEEKIGSDTVKNDEWYRSIEFLQKKNNVMIIAQKGAEFDTVRRLINYNPLLGDTAKPVIMEVTVRDSRDNLFISKNNASLKVIAFDEARKIISVTCDGLPFSPDASGYIWTVNGIELEHSPGGNILQITARTNTDSVSKKITVFYNHRPRFTSGPQFPCPVIVGKTYSTKITLEDGDAFDPVQLTLNMDDTSDKSMHLDNNGILTWIPLRDGPISKKKFTIKISDSYENVDSSFEAIVADTGQVFENAKFGKVLEQFPGFLEANKDTMHINLLPEKGTPEFTFQVDIPGTGKSLPVVNNILSWGPSNSDIGIVRMRIVVTDFILKTDTIYPVVTIVPKNLPLALRCEKITDTLVTGALNMRDTSKTVLLLFSIDDPDQDITEKFTAFVTQGGVVDTINLTSRIFTVSVNSSFYKHGIDTLRVRVTDRVSHSDKFQRIVDYGIEPHAPSLVSPYNNTAIDTKNVVLKWNANNDPTIRYELYLGSNNTKMKKIYAGTDKSFSYAIIDSASIYFWQVYASSGKEQIASPLWTFNLSFSKPIEIKTTEKEFKKYYIATYDTIRVPLRLVNSNPNVQFTAFYKKDSVPLPVINSILQAVPQIKDTGWQRIEIIAKDTIHFVSDTLFADIFIAGENLNVRLQLLNDFFAFDTLDLRAELQKDTLVFTIKSNVPGLNDGFRIEITQRNTTRTFSLDSSNTFMLVIEPGSNGLVSDSIDVKVTSTLMGSDSKKITVMYNVGLSQSVNTNSIADIIGENVKGLLR